MPQYWKQLLALTRPSIGRRMALLILAFSSVVTLVFTALQLSIEFNRDVRDIEAQLTQIRSSYSKSLANSLWVGSKHDVALQLEGINRLPDMQYSEVVSEQNLVVAQAGKRMVGRAPRIETPLYYTHRNRPVYVGKLLTVASLDGAYQRLKDKVIVILLSQFTKTLIVSLFILFLFQWLVGRYLKHIADYSEKLQAHQLDQPLALNRRRQNNPAEDELDLVVGAINTMRSNLHASTQDLRLSEQYRTTLFETSPIGLALARMDGTLVDVNPAYARIIGRTVPEVLGLTYLEITPQSYADQEQAQLRSLQESGHYGPYEKEYIHKDGHLVSVRLSGLIIERDGERYIWSAVEDITVLKQADAAAREALATLDATEDAALIFDPDTLRFSYVNEGAVKQLGFTREELLTMTPLDIKPEFDEPQLRQVLTTMLRGEKASVHHTTLHRRKDGRDLPVETTLQFIPTAGQKGRFIAIARDISERKQAEKALRQSEAQFRSIIDVTPVPYAINDNNQNITFLNAAFVQTFGYTFEDIPTLNDWWPKAYPDPAYRQWVTETWKARLDRARQEGTEFEAFEVNIQCKDGTVRTVLASAASLKDALTGMHLVILYDITERKQAEEHIWKQANFDTLTGLPNRVMFHDRMRQEMLKTERAQSQLALLLIDLDQFKEVNDALGHDVGDTLLQATAQRIRGCVRDSDTVARLGGDEFAVIISELAETATNLDEIAQKLIVELAAPYQLGDEIVHVSASIGISLYPNDASAIDVLLKTADQAMYAAKNLGRNCFSYFTAALQDAAQTRLRLSSDLRLALERKELLLHYQPQISVETGRVTGVEALVRWQHPEKGLIPPNLFIPIAEDTGLILPLGAWVMRTACQQLKKWHESGMIEVKMSVNLSARQFRQEGLATCVSALLAEMGLPAELLELEITESLAMDNPQENAVTLKSLRDIGVSVAIDDFGTGHSSLGYLKDFPISRLKLDRTFIMHIETEPSDAIIVSAAVNLAHALGMDVVAEGVETVKQVEYLARLNCDIIQGYYFSQPLLAAEAEVFIREHNVVPRTQMMQAQPDIDILVIDDDDWVCHFLTIVFKNMGHRPVTETDPLKGLEVLRQTPEKFELILLDMLLPNLSGIELVRKVRDLNREVPLIIITSYRSEAILKTFKPLEKELNLLHGINYFILEKPLTEESFSKQSIARITRKMGLATPQPA